VGRTILIVGNSDGIGAAITAHLVALGDRIVGISKSPSPAPGSGARHEIHDVASPLLPDLVRRLAREEGGFHACIYCAGIGAELTLPDFAREARVIDVNLTGMIRTFEALAPDWLAAKRGHFIGLSSIADDIYNGAAPSYSASKAGVSNYLLSVGLLLRAHGVAVTNVRFGFVDTKMAGSARKPFMITKEAAAQHIVRCLEQRPLQLTVPKVMGVAAHLLRLRQSIEIWLR
jgi:NAD(P)-dependent dehydrogenase (short-subunit alcohol dehydrogenase family)